MFVSRWRHFGALAALVLGGLVAHLPTSASANVAITINKTFQKMTVTVDGARQYVWPVSTGKSGYSTPGGSYNPFRMEAVYASKEWDDAPMPYSIFFTPRGHAIHGSNDRKHLGSPASHGCVRLDPANAAVLFELVKAHGLANTKVAVVGVDAASPQVTAQAKPKATARHIKRRPPPPPVEPEWNGEFEGELIPFPDPWFEEGGQYDEGPINLGPGWEFDGD